MRIISYTTARNNLATSMDQVCDDHTPLVINRVNGNSVVMISLDDYRAMEETLYLFRSPNNAKRLQAGIDEVEKMIAKKKRKKR